MDVRDAAVQVPMGAAQVPAGRGVASRLTPDLVRTASFRPARRGRGGLDPADVRGFCGQVEDELVLLLKERIALQKEVSRLRSRVLGGPDDTGAAGAAVGVGFRNEDAHARAVRILSRAQQTAARYVADAEEYSRRLAQDARRQREEILASAVRSAAALVRDAARGQAEAASGQLR